MKDLEHRITLIFIELFLGGYSGKKKIEFEKYRDEIYLFKSKTPSGIYFWFDNILMKEELFKKDYEDARKYVYLHEIGHRKQPKLLEIINGILVWYLHPFSIAFQIFVIALTSLSIFLSLETLWIQLLTSKKAATFLILFFPIAVVSSWILETMPDIFVLQDMDADRYTQCIDQLKDLNSSQPQINRIHSRLTHPTPNFFLWLNSWVGDTSS